MTRINMFRSMRETEFLAWGKGNLSAWIFAAVLIICSVTVGCSSDKSKPVTSNNQIPVAQPAALPAIPAPAMRAESKPMPKKTVVHKKAATVNYADKTYGVTFEYPRRYAIETGDAATQLLAQNPLAMNFVQPGGVALAAVELPETNYTNTDFSSAYFNVSVHKSLTADQCSEFAMPASKVTKPEPALQSEVAKQDLSSVDSKTADAKPAASETSTAKVDPKSDVKTDDSNSKLLIGDMELRATEAVSGEGTRQSDSKYFHVFQNGGCYEFALNVTTDASEEGLVKHVDRDKVFNRLEQILSTVKISAVTPEVTAEAPASTSATPAQ